jgi:hypothetical protein
MSALGLAMAPIFLSDSSQSTELSSVDTAVQWSNSVGANLIVDHADRRRSLKEALNVVLERTSTDLLVQMNADVVVPVESLARMLGHLLVEPKPAVAVGSVLPDPSIRGLRYRAGTWQLRAVWRTASIERKELARAEGAFWGAWRVFYAGYRYPIGKGSIHDDVELAAALNRGGFLARNAADAVVYKVPPGSLADLCSGSVRWQAAAPAHRRRQTDYAAALIETIRDPVGAVMYARARLWCRAYRRRFVPGSASEFWTPLQTTKRTSEK